MLLMIDRDAAAFEFEQLAAILKDRIEAGKYDSRLPPITALEAEFGLSSMTVRRALELLEGQGLIIRRPGRGTFLTPRLSPA